jgi:hypothetical protein
MGYQRQNVSSNPPPRRKLLQNRRVACLVLSPEADTESDGSIDSRSATEFPVVTDEETAIFPDPAQLWNQMISHRGANDWDLLAAVWSYLGCRPPAAVSRYTNQMVAATTDFLGHEEVTRLESRVNNERNINGKRLTIAKGAPVVP